MSVSQVLSLPLFSYVLFTSLSSNIFLDAALNAKIGDFGLATLGQSKDDRITAIDLDNTTSSLTSNIGTPFYVSPEVLDPTKKQNSVYTQKVDVFR